MNSFFIYLQQVNIMKKLFKPLSAIFLLLFSFYYTNKVVEIVRETDPIMKEIRLSSKKYEVLPDNARIIGNNIIPGKTGKEVDYEKSYTRMKQYGTYNEALTTFKEIEPTISVDDYYDKYIIQGNNERKSVALVFKITNNNKVQDLINILNNKNIKTTFFIDGLFLENNTDLIKNISNHELELLSYDQKYDELYFNSALNYLSSLTKENPKFCYAEYDQKEVLELCTKLKLHTIIPTIRVTDYPYKTIKGKLSNSSIISLPLTSQTINELPLIINYISQKGYSFLTLEELLSESFEK